MNYLKLAIVGLFSLICSQGFGQNNSGEKNIEKLIANCVDKALATSVYIIEYDTLSKKVQEGSGFSGVVVSAQGHILTVSHAAVPNQVYQISFPDGTGHVAVGLGRIGIQKGDLDLDMAMLKIIKPGKWQFAEIARSTELKVNQPVISISYPSSFVKSMPNLRFGRFTDLDFRAGFIESSCKMEPGDSGGALFDAMGRVVGIHSWIKENEDQNYDVPADCFLKYWSALNVPKDYQELPAADDFPPNESVVNIPSVTAIEDLGEISSRHSKSAILLLSNFGAQQLPIQGTIVEFRSASGTGTFILSKSSMVAEKPVARIDGKSIPLTVIKRDRENDLVLLKASTKLNAGLKLIYEEKDADLNTKDLGRILISAFAGLSRKVGVLSTVYIDMPLNSSVGYFGANATFINEKITITALSKGTVAAEFLRLKDEIIEINGVPIRKPVDYGNELAKYIAGDFLSVTILRSGNPMEFKMVLSGYPAIKHVSYEFPGGRSVRSDGFNKVLVQDAAIRADECGGPVFDVDSAFYGINIARHSRTSTVVMPASVLAKFIADALKN